MSLALPSNEELGRPKGEIVRRFRVEHLRYWWHNLLAGLVIMVISSIFPGPRFVALMFGALSVMFGFLAGVLWIRHHDVVRRKSRTNDDEQARPPAPAV
jgi:hypothetical protein